MNKDALKILVTGCGGDIGQSIGKILKSVSFIDSIIGCDIHDEHAGIFIFDKTFTISRCTSDSYLSDLEKIIDEMEVDVILPASEPELRFLTEQSIDKKFLNKILISSNLRSRLIGFDKLNTVRFLRKNNYPYPKTEVLSELDSPEFPLILKNRSGSGSKLIYKVDDSVELAFLKKKHPGFIAQEFISEKDGEYTCGLFRSKSNEILRSIIFKRTLTNGYSGFGTVIEDQRITNLLHSIAKDLDLEGSINVQLRFSVNEPLIFEINPRFSSTVLFRHMFGFHDLVWSLEDCLGLSVSAYNLPQAGGKFYKGYQEYIL